MSVIFLSIFCVIIFCMCPYYSYYLHCAYLIKLFQLQSFTDSYNYVSSMRKDIFYNTALVLDVKNLRTIKMTLFVIFLSIINLWIIKRRNRLHNISKMLIYMS